MVEFFYLKVIFLERNYNFDTNPMTSLSGIPFLITVIINIVTTRSDHFDHGPARRRARSRSRLKVFSTVLAIGVAPALAEEANAPPDPLSQPEAPVSTRSGYLESGGVPASLQTPGRLRVGDFIIKPSAGMSVVYDDNVEADDDRRNEDIFLTFSPAVRARSTYARHGIGFFAKGTAATTVKDSSEDFFDWRIGADGRLDLSRRSRINASVGYTRETEDDEAIDAGDARKDAVINVIGAKIGYDVDQRVIGWRLGTSLSRLDYNGSEFADRDRTTLGLSAAARYKHSERLTLSAGPSYSYATFDDDVADDGDSRDAHSLTMQVGGIYQASQTIATTAAIGYSLSFFDDPDRKDADSIVGNLGLTWNAGAGTTLRLAATRSLGLTIVDNADSRTTTTGSATLSHALKLGARSALTSSLAYSISRISDLDRTDHNVAASLGFAYRLSEHAFFNSGYRFSRRNADGSAADYYRNLISLGVTVAY